MPPATTDLQIVQVPIDDLHPDPKNPRKISAEELDNLTLSATPWSRSRGTATWQWPGGRRSAGRRWYEPVDPHAGSTNRIVGNSTGSTTWSAWPVGSLGWKERSDLGWCVCLRSLGGRRPGSWLRESNAERQQTSHLLLQLWSRPAPGLPAVGA